MVHTTGKGVFQTILVSCTGTGTWYVVSYMNDIITNELDERKQELSMASLYIPYIYEVQYSDAGVL